MKHGKDTIKQASDLISALYKADAIPVLSIDDRREFCDMVRIAKSLHRIAEHDCNGTKTATARRLPAWRHKSATLRRGSLKSLPGSASRPSLTATHAALS